MLFSNTNATHTLSTVGTSLVKKTRSSIENVADDREEFYQGVIRDQADKIKQLHAEQTSTHASTSTNTTKRSEASVNVSEDDERAIFISDILLGVFHQTFRKLPLVAFRLRCRSRHD